MDEETYIVMYGIYNDILVSFDSLQDAVKFIGKEKEKLKKYNPESSRPSLKFHVYKHVDTL